MKFSDSWRKRNANMPEIAPKRRGMHFEENNQLLPFLRVSAEDGFFLYKTRRTCYSNLPYGREDKN
jgi:hypothetical protein